MVVLTPYAGYERGSKQYRWLEMDLAAFDRGVTPWLVVSFHAPWYNTLVAHYQVSRHPATEPPPFHAHMCPECCKVARTEHTEGLGSVTIEWSG